ncbi:hypothetical protein AV274_5987 [Blastocystis sp. ATCC 50177/Nand II]|uniref:C2 domain-containing protein n=1 Tax=Blastocystis sp. subtype 1 (strain ATCC 50177 / NandII) TaxID=478820 RepID=A0A196S8P9_BLAHN|nr:hypothetical protein AV274_5987 [Blastocystis sp. ATCC 50177/Nand II]
MPPLPTRVVSMKFYRRILPGLRRLKHIRSIIVRNVKSDSVDKSCRLFFTIHIKFPGSNGAEDAREELVYTSETVEDTVNPEWNEFGNPLDIDKEAKEEKVFTLRVWNKEETENKLIIESVVSIQELDYLAPLEAVDIGSMINVNSIPEKEKELIQDNMSAGAIEQIFNALPFNAVLFCMTDGFFASHEVCAFLRRAGVLKQIEAPQIEAPPEGSHTCDFHFILTSLQQLYLQQSRTQRNDDRMALMKEMVEDAMRGPLQQNEQEVASKCLNNDIEQLKQEEASLRQQLDTEKAAVVEMKEELTRLRAALQEHCQTVADYDEATRAKDAEKLALQEKDAAIQQCLHARRTRLLAMVSFLFPLHQSGAEWSIKAARLPEMALRTTGQIPEAQHGETNAALGYLTHVVVLLARYFDVSLPFVAEYRSSASVVYDPNQEPPVHHPLFVGAQGQKDGDVQRAMAMMRENVQRVLDCEGIELEIDENVLSGIDKLFKKYIALTLEKLRQKIQTFAQERDWDQFHTPRNLLLAMMGEVGEVCEIMQWKGEMQRGVPELTEEERVHLGEELSDVLIYLVRLADRCNVDLPTAALRKMGLNAKKYPAEKVKGSSKKYNEY